MNLEERLADWFRGDAEAVNFALCMWDATQKWDDLEDEGQTDHNALLYWMGLGKELHPFYARHQSVLHASLLQLYLNWSAANVLDHGDRNDVSKAYVLRAGFYQVIHMIALLCGGHDWAVRVGPQIWREYGETADELWSEFNG